MIDLTDNFERARCRIADAQRRFGRKPGSVSLLAVSKFHGVDAVAAAVAAGQRCFAENYLQELRSKSAALTELFPDTSIAWHFTGKIQSKKARGIATLCDWAHSVDRIEVARKLSECRSAARPLNVCIQVNLDNEEGKSGALPDDLEALVRETATLPNLCARGLMAIPKPRQRFAGQRESFARLRKLFAALQPGNPSWDTLSMGMSADFEAAIAEGATIVRVGTALFGQR